MGFTTTGTRTHHDESSRGSGRFYPPRPREGRGVRQHLFRFLGDRSNGAASSFISGLFFDIEDFASISRLVGSFSAIQVRTVSTSAPSVVVRG